MAAKTTTWTLEGHTQGKYLVLTEYMGAWLPIMTKWNGRVLFIEAFVGPGEYSGGPVPHPSSGPFCAGRFPRDGTSPLAPLFFKQWGGVFKKRHGRLLDGRIWDEMPGFEIH
jgi:hypothetical protein